MSFSGPEVQPVQPQHPPYPPATAVLGGAPTNTIDGPITSIFLAFFVLGAAAHLIIFQVNMKRGKKFAISVMLFAFCMGRITTCIMRLVWSTHLANLHIAIAAQIFVQAGALLLFIANLIFAQRILRASHPSWAWTKWFSLAFKLYYVSILLMLIAIITCTVQSFYTLSPSTYRIGREIQLVGATYFAVAAFLPVPLLLLRLPKKLPHVEKFGQGRFRTKMAILLFSSFILTLGAAFRAGIAYVPRSRIDPAWYHSKACFYIFNFSIEIIVVSLYAIIRVDKRFIIHDGSHAPGDYSAGHEEDGKESKPSLLETLLSEETVVGGEGNGEEQAERQRKDDIEKAADDDGPTATLERASAPDEAEVASEKGERNVEVGAFLKAKFTTSTPTSSQGIEGTAAKEERAVEGGKAVEEEKCTEEEKSIEANAGSTSKVEGEKWMNGALENESSAWRRGNGWFKVWA